VAASRRGTPRQSGRQSKRSTRKRVDRIRPSDLSPPGLRGCLRFLRLLGFLLDPAQGREGDTGGACEQKDHTCGREPETDAHGVGHNARDHDPERIQSLQQRRE